MSNETVSSPAPATFVSSPAPATFVSSPAPATFVSSPQTAGLEYPQNIFNKQNKISDNLNKFQIRYARYLRCQNENTAQNVDPPCDFVGRDSFSELQKAYQNLMDDLNELDDVYKKQSTYNAKTVEVYNENTEQLEENYKTLQEERNKLDNQLKELQEYSEGKLTPELLQLKSVNIINTLLIIAFFYLIYVLFMDL